MLRVRSRLAAMNVPGRQMMVMMEMNVILRLSTLAAIAMLKFALVSALFVYRLAWRVLFLLNGPKSEEICPPKQIILSWVSRVRVRSIWYLQSGWPAK